MVHKKGSTWTDWDESIVNQTKTGYDVGETEKDAQLDKKDTVKSQYILTFPNIQDTYQIKQADGTFKTYTLNAGDGAKDARYNADPSKYLWENDKSRYIEETVKISFRSATKVEGKESTVRSAN